jgi:hypothetical protein
MKEWRYGSTILDLGTGWRWVVSFMPRLLCSQGRNPWSQGQLYLFSFIARNCKNGWLKGYD